MELLERDDQLAAADAILGSAAGGSGRLAVVEGPPGIGKTEFCAAVGRRARALGFEVLAARCGELEVGFAFGAVRQLFERRLAAAPAAERRSLLAGAARLARPVVAPGRSAAAPGGDLQPVLHGLYWLADNLAARRPLLLVVDDAQWADAPSLRFFAYLARRLAEVRLLLLLSARSLDAGLALEPAAVAIPLPPLGEAAVARLVADRLGEHGAALAGACHRVTGGNPFLVQELLAHLGALPAPTAAAVTAGAPATVRASVEHRLGRLPPVARALAAAAAVLDLDATVARCAALAGITVEEAESAADALAAAQLWRDARPPAFTHALVRTAVLAATPLGERRVLHGRAAARLAGDGAEPSVVASHLVEVDPVGEPWAVAALAEAARRALDLGDPQTAAAWLRRALEEPVRPGRRGTLLRDLALAEERLGDPAATGHLRQAFALMEDPVDRAQTLRALLLAMLAEGRGDEVRAMLDRTLPELADADLAVRIEAEVLSAGRHTLQPSLWLADRLRSWRGRADPERPGGRLLLANLATQCALDGGSAGEAAELAELALGGGRLLREQAADSMPVFQAAWQLTAAGRLDAAEAAIDAALADAGERGSVVGVALGSVFHSYLELARGRVPAAEADAAAALAAAAEARPGWFGRPAAVAAMLDVLIERARLPEAARLLEEHGAAGELPDSVPNRLLLHSRGWLRLAEGYPAAAAADFLDHLERERRLGALSAHLVPSHAGAALALRAGGDVGRASEHAAAAVDAARGWGAPRVVARALRVRAWLEPPRAAVATLEQAAGLAGGSPARLDEAWARLELGAALVRLGRRADGAAQLRLALDLGHRCGGLAVAAAARAELVASGYRPRRAAASGADALTGSERNVVRLAARGMPNREIAQVLFVTERTVELHLTNAYHKLGVSSRRELPRVMVG